MPKEARRNLKHLTRLGLLTEAGYRCSSPRCQVFLTLEVHHIEHVSDGGGEEPGNLIVLCPNCHSLHHSGQIESASLLVWKASIVAANSPYDRPSFDLMTMLDHLGGSTWLDGSSVTQFARLVGPGLVTLKAEPQSYPRAAGVGTAHKVSLTEKGKRVLDAWRDGRGVLTVE